MATQSGGADGSDAGAPYVGGDLHTVTAIDGRLYVGGHDGVAVSSDEGQSWKAVSSLEGADAMGWAQTSSGLLVGGHPGRYSSTEAATLVNVSDKQAQLGHRNWVSPAAAALARAALLR